MRRITLALGICVTLAGANQALGQCQGGGGGGTTAGGGTTGTTTLASTPTLLTGQGSLAYQMMQAAAIRQQLAQMQMLRAQQKAADRQVSLAKRQKNAERTRLAKAEARERTRQQLAAQSGIPRPASPATPPQTQLARR